MLKELDSLVGLDDIKQDVHSIINILQIRKIRNERNLKSPDISLHMVFSGNPGTGKTTVARILGKIYKEIGVLSKGHLIEVDRSSLVAGYVGQTAIKTKEMITQSLGGILFIDEAYALAVQSENDFGSECISTLLKAMEDHRDDLIVIVAGYTDKMDFFLNSNPGLRSRFNKHFIFHDYNVEELVSIFMRMLDQNDFIIEDDALAEVKNLIEKMYTHKPPNFGNGREMRNLFEKMIANQANRLMHKESMSDQAIQTFTLEDLKGLQ